MKPLFKIAFITFDSMLFNSIAIFFKYIHIHIHIYILVFGIYIIWRWWGTWGAFQKLRIEIEVFSTMGKLD